MLTNAFGRALVMLPFRSSSVVFTRERVVAEDVAPRARDEAQPGERDDVDVELHERRVRLLDDRDVLGPVERMAAEHEFDLALTDSGLGEIMPRLIAESRVNMRRSGGVGDGRSTL